MPITTYLATPLPEGESIPLTTFTIPIDDDRAVSLAEYPLEDEKRSFVVTLKNGENELRFRVSLEALEALIVLFNHICPYSQSSYPGLDTLARVMARSFQYTAEMVSDDSGDNRSDSDSA